METKDMEERKIEGKRKKGGTKVRMSAEVTIERRLYYVESLPPRHSAPSV
jgi:hypothetical protein